MNKIKNCEDNLDLVISFGDQAMLNSGNIFSNYARFLTLTNIANFCEITNADESFGRNGFRLIFDRKNLKNINTLKLSFCGNDIAMIKLLDYTIFCSAEECFWKELSREEFNVFNYILNSWRAFLSENILGYKEQFNKTIILSNMDYSCCI